ncbi:cell division protein FtsX [Pseudooceanicola spongiae]|uniref:Cell division protein FtsX n=1 Tax=Pseudooceanicola spongiae TaxID=2613965 RepID=A0A7L9WV44_9RHOB|nr:FtsX-like permease family protein [Pseudooceanicola spongiae]QOL82950.1 cell division protein FtsX [Pseudooceanicola spongiae]
MRRFLLILADLVRGDTQADRVVPPTGFTARLTLFSAAAMTFLAVFALALSLATGRLAHNWSAELARSATLRLSASDDQIAAQTQAALSVLKTTEGVESARALSEAEQQALLEPWFGPDVPIADLPVPQLIEIIETRKGYDAEGLRLRLAAEVPGAVLDDHTRWRRPLVRAASRIRTLGLLSLALIGAIMAAMITLAAHSALAANAQVISVLRLVGARDDFIARAFVRRFTLRAISGAILGLALGLGGIMLLPAAQAEGGFLTGLGFQGWGWIWPFFLPLLAGVVAFWATRSAARRILRGLA